MTSGPGPGPAGEGPSGAVALADGQSSGAETRLAHRVPARKSTGIG